MKTKLLIFSLLLGLSACVKNEELVPINSTTPVNVNNPSEQLDLTGQKLVAQGSFMNSARYSTSGTAKVYEKDGKRILVFEDFKTSAGPDLRIYFAEDKDASKFVEVSKLANTGNFFIELPTSVNPAKQKFVLIWCKQFAVLFGNAELK
jgi:Electron transfer DM13